VRFVARIHVRPRPEVRDPQGDAVAAALRSIGIRTSGVRVGKEVVVRYDANDEKSARSDADRMGRELLANPVVEEFAFELAPQPSSAAEEDTAPPPMTPSGSSSLPRHP
jgi:phosphoribosylformylglycinamidine synthase PurS subunit